MIFIDNEFIEKVLILIERETYVSDVIFDVASLVFCSMICFLIVV